MRRPLLFVAVLAGLTAAAAPVTPEQARDVASRFVHRAGARLAPGAQRSTLRLAYTAPHEAYYVFNLGAEAGYVMVAGDDRAPEVLAYADGGDFDIAGMPVNAREWFTVIEGELARLQANPQLAPRRTVRRPRVVSPLVTSTWDQSKPYNLQTPYFNGTTTHAYVGCAATAAAQIMYYYRWPAQGVGSNSYTCDVGRTGTEQTLSRDFSQSRYDWDNMIDHYSAGYTTAQGNAVAQLMADVGIAMNMDYIDSETGSAAGMDGVRTALVDHMSYDASVNYVGRDAYSVDEWEQLLVDELDAGRPVLYAGYAPTGGHAFVCDGYDSEGLFHFNWGWSGNSNGYFVLTALNPSDQGIGSFEGGYNSGQEVLVGIKPDEGGSPVVPGEFTLYLTSFLPEVTQANLGDEISMPLSGFRALYATAPEQFIGGFLTYTAAGDYVDAIMYNFGTSFPANHSLGWGTQYKVPASLADGDYEIYFGYNIDPDAEYYSWPRMATGKSDHVCMRVSGGVAYFSEAPSDATLTVERIAVPEHVTQGSAFDVEATLGSVGGEYYNNVYVALLTAAGTATSVVSGALSVDVSTSRTVKLTTQLTADVTPGDYQVVVLNNLKEQVGAGVNVTVVEATTPSLQLTSGPTLASTRMPAGDIRATAVVTNASSQPYYGQLRAVLTPQGGTSIKANLYTTYLSIAAGETATVNFSGAINALEGTNFDFVLINPNEPESLYIWGERSSFTIMANRRSVTLAQLVSGEVSGDDDFLIDSNVAIVAANEIGSEAVVTDGDGNWAHVYTAGMVEASQLTGDVGLRHATITGNYEVVDGNPVITLTSVPTVQLTQAVEPVVYDLTEPFAPQPCELVTVKGYYTSRDMEPQLRAYAPSASSQGQSVDLLFDWCPDANDMVDGRYYELQGVAMLKSAWDDAAGAPRRMSSDDNLAFQNYVVYVTATPSVLTALADVKADAATVTVGRGSIAVAGAHSVRVVDMTGRVFSTTAATQVPAGIYVVIVDGVPHKVMVR